MARIYFGISDVDSENVGLVSKIRTGRVGACSLGDLTQGKPRKHLSEERHPTPNGCQWARDCEECPWGDCVLVGSKKPPAYDSAAAKAMRRSGKLADMRQEGMSIVCIAGLAGVHVRTVERDLAKMFGSSKVGISRETPKTYPASLCPARADVLGKQLQSHNLAVLDPLNE